MTVLNFSSEQNYIIDGINVITEKTYIQQQKKYDIVVSHPQIFVITIVF